MSVEEFDMSNVQTRKPLSEDEKLPIVKLGVNQRLRNITIDTFRTGVSKMYGSYLNVFFTDIDEQQQKIMRVSLPDEEGKNTVFNKQFLNTFTYQDDETGYFMLKPQFEGVPIWVGKGQPAGKRYHVLAWGYEEQPEQPMPEDAEPTTQANENSSIDATVNYSNQQGTAGYYLQNAYNDGTDKFMAAKILVDNLGYTTNDAMSTVEEYYQARDKQAGNK